MLEFNQSVEKLIKNNPISGERDNNERIENLVSD